MLKKYTVKPPRDLTSKFEKKQAAKAKAEQEAEDAKRRAEEEQKNAVSSTWTSFWDMHFPQNMWFFCVLAIFQIHQFNNVLVYKQNLKHIK